ncbi:MAG: hypothetical protein WCI67_02755 [Chloroflexales bacterium]
MVTDSRTRRNVRSSALLLLCLGLVMLLPGHSGAAQGSTAQVVDNTQGDFADGNFQRTSIGPAKVAFTVTPPDPADTEGLVQLAPAGKLNPWDSIATSLPLDAAVAEAGVTAVGRHIYAIGGTTSGGFTDAAYWAMVDPATGSLVLASNGTDYWTNSPMPGAVVIPADLIAGVPAECQTLTAKRTRAGVASVVTGTDTGYIYVVGGAVNPDPVNCVSGGTSTALIQRGTVAANGAITWATLSTPAAPGLYLPSPLSPSDDGSTDDPRTLGVEGASVVIAHTKGSTGTDHYYLYVIGGKSRYLEVGGAYGYSYTTIVRALTTVYYTEINIADGSLKHPITGTIDSTGSVWKRDANMTLVVAPLADEGLWDATATATSVAVGTELKSAIFLAGGSLDSDKNPATTKINPYVYRADVNKDTGALTWATRPNTIGTAQVTLAAARRSMASVSYNNKLYMIGGRTNDTMATGLATVPTALYDDNLDLIKLDPASADYFTGVSTTDVVLKDGTDAFRSSPGAAVVRAEPPTGATSSNLNSAWVYVIGGIDQAGSLKNTVFLGKVGGEGEASGIRAPDGWYYSGVIKTSFEFGSGSSLVNKQARVLALHWAADIDRATTPNADIQIDFRKTITASGECPSESVFTSSTDDRWRSVDGYAASPFYSMAAANGAVYNTVTMADAFGSEQLNASCIQYRAHFMQSSVSGAFTPTAISPKLLSVYIEKTVVGNADINIPTNGFSVTTTSDKHISSFVMQVQNLSDKGLSETLSVPDARMAEKPLAGAGSFYVFLCIARADPAQAVPSLTLPDPNNLPVGYEATCPAAALIQGYEMDKGTVIDLRQSKNSRGDPRWYNNTTNQPISDIMSLFTTSGRYRIGLVVDPLNYVPEGLTGEANNLSPTIAFDLASGSSVFLPFLAR